MIDTVVFRIHDIETHLRLAEYLHKKVKSSGKTIRQKVGEEDFTVMQHLTNKTYITYHDTGNLFEIGHFDHLKSSHYNIAYKVDYVKDCIEFNVSVPKYAYGTNVLQYMPNPFSATFSHTRHESIDYCLSISYNLLMHFFTKFFRTEFGEIEIYKQFVEVVRVDLCYNQVFNSKDDALEYLKQVKRVKKKFSRDTSNYSRSWETSMMYTTKHYSFKVYHKGSEYRANDSKKHRQINKEARKQIFDTNYIAGFADKMLRYEMTIRNTYMSYLYMNHLFRKDCPHWRQCMRMYKEYRNKSGTDKYLSWRRSLEPEEKRQLEYAKGFIHKTKKFFMSKKYLDNAFDAETDYYYVRNWPEQKERFDPMGYFSPELFSLLGKKFTEVLEEFELELYQDKHTIMQKLELHNKSVDLERKRLRSAPVVLDADVESTKSKISMSKISVALELLEKYNFSEIQKLNIYKRTTWYNIRKDLELLGVTEKSLLNLTVNASFNHKNYFTELLYNRAKFRGLDFVN